MQVVRAQDPDVEDDICGIKWEESDIELAISLLKPGKPVRYTQMVKYVISQIRPENIDCVMSKSAGFHRSLETYLMENQELDVIIIDKHQPLVVKDKDCKIKVINFMGRYDIRCNPYYGKMRRPCPDCKYVDLNNYPRAKKP